MHPLSEDEYLNLIPYFDLTLPVRGLLHHDHHDHRTCPEQRHNGLRRALHSREVLE
jgi:hypothetical protein